MNSNDLLVNENFNLQHANQVNYELYLYFSNFYFSKDYFIFNENYRNIHCCFDYLQFLLFAIFSYLFKTKF